ncbi:MULTISPECIES: VOC family protein [unclassified Pseudomonas]|uniref:bleomycin resistance protein n=1 Tax=unclassified Pseudomonas TaxID=196821 RepID=UPI002AC92BD3|nr:MULTISPECIES: VOC family protein [unclassified Pseudomonas]MEB0044919.1 VOC family protein [Pseudomonas sp. Dout3]MEB0096069.1 VOC family protein [Pseudomonas sp. DC1.2]WPX57931.1 VOC family protein [Pseudomonas sp. DC1.2]
MFVRSTLVPELMVTDILKSLHFWTALIGFNIAYERPEEGFAYLDQNGAQLMLEQYNSNIGQWLTAKLEAPFGRGINFQITVDSVEPILHRLAEAEWPLYRSSADAWYRAGAVEVGQREFLVKDPDGYLVRLVESLGERPCLST